MQPERCHCGEEVLTVVGLASTWVVDAIEVFPEGPCSTCKGKGKLRAPGERRPSGTYHLAHDKSDAYVPQTGRSRDVACWRCGGSGVLGERPQRGMILVDVLGFGRRWYGQTRATNEAFHREHVCSAQRVGLEPAQVVGPGQVEARDAVVPRDAERLPCPAAA